MKFYLVLNKNNEDDMKKLVLSNQHIYPTKGTANGSCKQKNNYERPKNKNWQVYELDVSQLLANP